MGTDIASFDLAERDLAAAELDQIVRVSRDRGADAWKKAVLDWHCAAIAKARTEAWIPGMAGSQDEMVEKILKRFYHHRIAAVLRTLKAENLKLRRDLIDALRRVRLYGRGRTDDREPECSTVEGLQSNAN